MENGHIDHLGGFRPDCVSVTVQTWFLLRVLFFVVLRHGGQWSRQVRSTRFHLCTHGQFLKFKSGVESFTVQLTSALRFAQTEPRIHHERAPSLILTQVCPFSRQMAPGGCSSHGRLLQSSSSSDGRGKFYLSGFTVGCQDQSTSFFNACHNVGVQGEGNAGLVHCVQ